jgi:molybdenum cofactor cytidylyltransferase
MTMALLPAGGLSARMGQPKLLLPFRGQTILHAVVGAFREAGVGKVLVVATPLVPELAKVANGAGARALVLDQPTPDMRATVDQGLAWIERHWQPVSTDWWFLCPADHPAIHPDVMRAMLRVAKDEDAASVLRPVRGGQRGHPILVRWSEVQGLRAFPADQGLNAYFRSMPQLVREVEVVEAAGFADLDTPEDYQRLLLEDG